MRNLSRYIFLIVILALTSAYHGADVIAQGIPFSVSVNKKSVALNGQVQVSFKINGSAKKFKAPSFSNFNKLGGPNRSSSIQFINGKRSESLSYTYVLQPKKLGNLVIGQASVEINGKTYKSKPITIKATKAVAQQSRTNQQAAQQGVNEKNIFIRAQVSKTNPYMGEGIRVNYKLYANVNIVNYAVDKLPSLSGFWTQDIEVPTPLQLKNEVIDGVTYRSAILKQVLLFPQQSGELVIDPLAVEFIARINAQPSRSNDPFSMFFGRSRDVRYIAKSGKRIINVKKLPGGAPPSFNGAVGKLKFETKLDKERVTANEPVTMLISVNGSGNLNLIDPPSIEFPPDVEAYDPKINANYSAQGVSMTGKKTFEYLLIPRLAGSYEIDPIEFSYFDIGSKSYKSFQSDPIVIDVQKGTDEQVATSGANLKSEFQVLNEDIRFIKPGPVHFINIGKRFYSSPIFYALLILPFVLFGGSLAYKGKLDEMNSDLVAIKSRKATRMAHKRLRHAKKFRGENNAAGFYEEISKALWGYVSDKLNIPVASLSIESASDKLRSMDINDIIIEELRNTLEKCEMSRFSPSNTNSSLDNTYTEAIAIIEKIEGQIK